MRILKRNISMLNSIRKHTLFGVAVPQTILLLAVCPILPSEMLWIPLYVLMLVWMPIVTITIVLKMATIKSQSDCY